MPDETLLRAAHSSLAVTFGTTADYHLGKIRVERVGYAGIPCITVPVTVKKRDMSALVPIARQHVFAYLAERGLGDEVVEFRPTIGGSYRQTRFAAQDGKRRMGCRLEYRFEIRRAHVGVVIWDTYSYGHIPAVWELREVN